MITVAVPMPTPPLTRPTCTNTRTTAAVSVRSVAVTREVTFAIYRLNRSAVIVGAGFDAAGVGEEAADPVGDGVVSFGLAGSAAFDGVLG